MTGRSDTERFLDAFLAPEGADQLSDRVLEAALSDIARTPQRRALRVPWRFTNMPVFARAAATALALVVLAGAGGMIYLSSGGALVGGPKPTAAPTPSAKVTALLSGFLEARVAGKGAQEYLGNPDETIPLLYATTSGARYDRGELEQVRGIEWPYGWIAFKVRLFARATVVEQLVFAPPDGSLGLEYQPDGFATDIAPTTEDGQPLAVSYTYFEGTVTLKAAHPWVLYYQEGVYQFPGGRLIPEGPGVRPTTDGGERHDWDQLLLMAHPSLVGTGCQTGPSPAGAAALAESIRSDPGLTATAPVAVTVGGADGVVMDLRIAAGASICSRIAETGDLADDPGVLSLLRDLDGKMTVANGFETGQASGEWMRLYLFDAPAGSSLGSLAIAIIAPESTFERAADAAAPVVNSVTFHAP